MINKVSLLALIVIVLMLCAISYQISQVDLETTASVEPVVVEKEVLKIVEVEKPIQVGAEAMVQPEPESEAKDFIILFHGGDWESIKVLNAIAAYIIVHGYGYQVEQVPESNDTMLAALPLGDVHVNMELWRFNYLEWYNSQIAAGRLIDLGAVFESSTQGWYVPRYVIEGDRERGTKAMAPDLRAVTDLPKYWEVFKDPEDPTKGVWINCIIDWACYKITQIRADAYGLNDRFNFFEPESSAKMDAMIVNAYNQRQPVIFHSWELNRLIWQYDMVKLEEPENTDECWEAITEAATLDPLGKVQQACGYPTQDIHKGVYGGLLAEAPEVVFFLKNMFFGVKRLGELSIYIQNANQATPEEVAMYYLRTYEAEWTTWVPDDVAAKVKAAIP